MSVATAPETDLIFDRQSVLDMVDGELDFVCELVEIFLGDIDAQIDAVKQGLASGDASVVQKICHRLKTSVGNLGGVRARPAVLELEQLARKGILVGAGPLFDRFISELSTFEAELKLFLSASK